MSTLYDDQISRYEHGVKRLSYVYNKLKAEEQTALAGRESFECKRRELIKDIQASPLQNKTKMLHRVLDAKHQDAAVASHLVETISKNAARIDDLLENLYILRADSDAYGGVSDG